MVSIRETAGTFGTLETWRAPPNGHACGRSCSTVLKRVRWARAHWAPFQTFRSFILLNCCCSDELEPKLLAELCGLN